MIGESREKQETAEKTADKCSRCGLQIGRQGSMTLWIFQDRRCKCGTPSPIAQSTPAMKSVSSPRQSVKKVLNGRYELVEIVGQGGASIVYRANDMESGKALAIKLMRQDIAENETAVRRFQKEVNAASELKHPNLGRIHGYGQDPEGLPYIVMDLEVGENLEQLLKRGGKLELKEALSIFNQICEGLMCAHEQMVIHRDLKPSNVIISVSENREPTAKIIDFGFAKIMSGEADSLRLTQTGEVFGSPLYMSPEHCLGQELDVRSDVYSIGCLMYETLTGKPPLSGDNVLATVAKQVRENADSMRVLNPSLPQNIDSVVLRCLEKEPVHRYQTVRDLMLDLDLVRRGKQIQAPMRAAKPTIYAGEARYLRNTEANRGRTLKLVVLSVFLTLLFGSIVGMVLYMSTRTQTPSATLSPSSTSPTASPSRVSSTESPKQSTTASATVSRQEESRLLDGKTTLSKTSEKLTPAKRILSRPHPRVNLSRRSTEPASGAKPANTGSGGWKQLLDMRGQQ